MSSSETETTRPFMEPHFGHDFSSVKAHGAVREGMQTWLTVDQPGHACERRADLMAERAMQTAQSVSLREPSDSGSDFNRVRIHTDGMAGESARAANVLDYTADNNMVVAARQYTPTKTDNKTLLAHGLTHVAQQQKAPSLLQKEDECPYECGCMTRNRLEWRFAGSRS